MDLNITSTKDDKHFERKIINFKVTTEPKDSFKLEDIRKKLMEKETIGFLVVYTVKNVYGKRELKGVAHVYKDENHAKALLQKYILKRNGVQYAERKQEKESK